MRRFLLNLTSESKFVRGKSHKSSMTLGVMCPPSTGGSHAGGFVRRSSHKSAGPEYRPSTSRAIVRWITIYVLWLRRGVSGWVNRVAGRRTQCRDFGPSTSDVEAVEEPWLKRGLSRHAHGSQLSCSIDTTVDEDSIEHEGESMFPRTSSWWLCSPKGNEFLAALEVRYSNS